MSDFPPERFSLFDRGPLFHWSWRAGLASPNHPGHPRLWLALTAAAWLPLLLLALLEGKAYSPAPGASVLSDWAVTGRLLIGMPLLIALQTRTDRQLGWIVRCLRSAGTVAPDDTPLLDRLIESTGRLAHSTLVEAILVVLALGQSMLLVSQAVARGGLQWLFGSGPLGLSLPGWWTVAVAMPLSALISARWAWRVVLWWRFCWSVSRMELRIVPSHPDGVGGLAFLNLSLAVFAAAAAGMLAGAAGQFATRVLATGAGLADLQFQFAGGLLGAAVLFAGPLLLFTGALARAKVSYMASYGALVCDQGRAFDDRWLVPGAAGADSLSQPDFSARTDLNSVAQLAYQMRLTVFTGRHLAMLLLGAALPFAPVAFLLLPAREMLKGLFGLLF